MKRIQLITAATAVAIAIVALAGCSSGSTSPASSAGTFGNCQITGASDLIKLDTQSKDTLTAATVLPFNGWWNGATPETIDGGFEYCMMANIAHRAGLKSVTVENQSWDQLISGSKQNYDMASAAITITDPRKKVFDFSSQYFDSNLGVAIKKGSGVTAANISGKRIGVLQGNMGAQFAANQLKATTQQFGSDTEMFTALLSGQVDAVITDTTLALTDTAASKGQLEVVAQYAVDQGYGIVMPKGTKNADAVDKAIADMKSDGTLDKLSATWLKPLFGVDPNTIPFWKVQ